MGRLKVVILCYDMFVCGIYFSSVRGGLGTKTVNSPQCFINNLLIHLFHAIVNDENFIAVHLTALWIFRGTLFFLELLSTIFFVCLFVFHWEDPDEGYKPKCFSLLKLFFLVTSFAGTFPSFSSFLGFPCTLLTNEVVPDTTHSTGFPLEKSFVNT